GPKLFWISAFFFTQSFITELDPTDKLGLEYEVTLHWSASDIVVPPDDGSSSEGPFLEGARTASQSPPARSSTTFYPKLAPPAT
ncbi:hypothetical protein HK405_011597, partial [Cladochytrium tenue]